MILRACKALVVFFLSLYLLLIAGNNLLDYPTNLAFVRHVMAMDTVPNSREVARRAFASPGWAAAAYHGIIAWEMLAGLWLLGGSAALAASLGSAPAFEKARSFTLAGLTFTFLLWLFPFLTIGGEWFLMWQSSQWNVQPAAFRMLVTIGLPLLWLSQGEPGGEPK
jgi:predicted small integral membrane protein